MSKPWEIYTLSDPRTHEVRYVGVTFRGKKRYNEHISRAMTGGKTHRDCWIRSLITAGMRPLYRVVETGSGDGWQDAERVWIAKYRQSERLVNHTDGGDGTPGLPISPEMRRKLSEARRGVPYLPGRISAMKGRKHTLEALEKIRVASKGRKMPDSMRRKLSVLRKQTPTSPEQRARMHAASRETRQTPEFRQKAMDAHAHQGKKVLCVETGAVFPSINAAARSIGVSKGAIQFALRRATPCKGHTLKAL